MASIDAAVQCDDRVRVKPFHTGGVLMLSLCHFVHDVYSSFLSPLLPLLIEKFSLSLTRAGLLSTVMQLPALLNPLSVYGRIVFPSGGLSSWPPHCRPCP